jgi:hypothetical protein
MEPAPNEIGTYRSLTAICGALGLPTWRPGPFLKRQRVGVIVSPSVGKPNAFVGVTS